MTKCYKKGQIVKTNISKIEVNSILERLRNKKIFIKAKF